MSFLLNGDKMRERLMRILEQAERREIHQDQEGEISNDGRVSHAGAFE